MENKIFDIAIIGGGPAGLSAALTGRIRNKSVVLFERAEFSPKLQKAHAIDNYPGLPKMPGKELIQQMVDHAMAYEPQVVREKVNTIYAGQPFTILTPQDTYEAKTIILATGVSATSLLPGEKELLGRGVSYCATCDGMFFKDKKVAVIAYSAEAEEETKYLAEICAQVYYLPLYKGEHPPFAANVHILSGQKPVKIEGNDETEALVTDAQRLEIDGIFVLRQVDPVENLVPGLELDKNVIQVKRDMSTNIPGLFAAGDCTGMPLQIAKASGEGLIAVLSAISWLAEEAKQST